ncbi:MAG: hypothetical protein AAF514_12045, partial [Verrucomicrobiota bacterium]
HGDSILGSIYFMAPEQFERAPLDVRTDLYSMGCMYYQALAGQYPFQGETAAQVMASHLQNRVTHLKHIRNDLPENICDWVMWLLAREKDERPTNASSCLREFQGIIREVNAAGMNSAPDIKSNAKKLSKQNLTSRRLIIPKDDTSGTPNPRSQTERQAPKGATTRTVAPQNVSDRSVSVAGVFLALTMAVVAIIGVIAFNRFSENKNKEAEFLALTQKKELVGDAGTVDLLVDFLQLEEHANHSLAAGGLLARLRGPGVEDRIIDHLKKGDAAYKLKILGVCNTRKPKPRKAVLEILRLTSSPDPGLRKSASDTLHYLADDRDLGFLVEAFKKEKSSSKRIDLAETIAKICKNSENPQVCRDTLLKTYEVTTGPTHHELLVLLGCLGNKEILERVKEKIDSGDPQAKAAAFRALHNWPNSDAADFVFNLAIAPGIDDASLLSLTRAYLKMASLKSTQMSDKKEMFGHLLELASNPQTINGIYSQLATIPEQWALDLANKESRPTYESTATAAAEKIRALMEERLNP